MTDESRGAAMIAMVVGQFDNHTQDGMQAAAQRAGAQCIFASDSSRAIRLLRSLEVPPRCVFASVKADLALLCESLRDSVEYYTIPLVGLVSYPSCEWYQSANRLGADDTIPEYDTGAITRRLANLADGDAPHLPATGLGRALVGVADEQRRRYVGRRLRSAGYEVEFISADNDLLSLGDKEPAAVLVATPSFRPVYEKAKGRNADQIPAMPFVTVPRSDGDPISPRELSKPEMAERLMFLVDEATKLVPQDARASRRIQHSLMTTFQSERSFEHNYALTDNISRQGLYVRTLDPPPVGEQVRINVRDKYGDILQVRGAVAWRHAPSQVGGRTCHGFGVRINEAACCPDDLAKYRALYDEVLKELEASKGTAGVDAPSGVYPVARTNATPRLPAQSGEMQR